MTVRLQSNAPKPYTVMTVVRSESGSWEYEIRVSHKTGVTYCTCKRWQFHKQCKHLDAYLKNPTIAVVPSAVTVTDMTPRTPGDVLRAELAALGLTITQASANAISVRILNAGGKVAKASTSSDGDHLNTSNVRVITLPD